MASFVWRAVGRDPKVGRLVLIATLLTLPLSLLAIAGIVREGAGTGFFLSEEGYILTNFHVVKGADEITVFLRDGRSLPARTVAFSPTWDEGGYDIALLKVEGTGFLALPLGNSDQVELYDELIALGFPLSFELGVSLTVTGGHLTSLRKLSSSLTVFQTDVPANPGNSGGPLLNTYGEVVGVITSRWKEAQLVTFALPINLVKTWLLQFAAPTRSLSPMTTSLHPKDIVRQVQPALVYVRAKRIVALRELLPTSIGGFVLQPPCDCAFVFPHSETINGIARDPTPCERFVKSLVERIGTARWEQVLALHKRELSVFDPARAACTLVGLEFVPNPAFIGWLRTTAVGAGILMEDDVIHAERCADCPWRWYELCGVPLDLSATGLDALFTLSLIDGPRPALAGCLPSFVVGFAHLPGLDFNRYPSGIENRPQLAESIAKEAEVADAWGVLGGGEDVAIGVWVLQCKSDAAARQWVTKLSFDNLFPKAAARSPIVGPTRALRPGSIQCEPIQLPSSTLPYAILRIPVMFPSHGVLSKFVDFKWSLGGLSIRGGIAGYVLSYLGHPIDRAEAPVAFAGLIGFATFSINDLVFIVLAEQRMLLASNRIVTIDDGDLYVDLGGRLNRAIASLSSDGFLEVLGLDCSQLVPCRPGCTCSDGSTAICRDVVQKTGLKVEAFAGLLQQVCTAVLNVVAAAE